MIVIPMAIMAFRFQIFWTVTSAKFSVSAVSHMPAIPRDLFPAIHTSEPVAFKDELSPLAYVHQSTEILTTMGRVALWMDSSADIAVPGMVVSGFGSDRIKLVRSFVHDVFSVARRMPKFDSSTIPATNSAIWP
jgi:hypothetical protein